MAKIKSVSAYCEQCKGKYWNPDQSKRQKVVMENFKIIPNNCVDAADGRHLCPFLKK